MKQRVDHSGTIVSGEEGRVPRILTSDQGILTVDLILPSIDSQPRERLEVIVTYIPNTFPYCHYWHIICVPVCRKSAAVLDYNALRAGTVLVAHGKSATPMALVRVKEQHVEDLAHLLDDAFRLGGSGFRFGLDPVIGLVPVIGDALVTAWGAAILIIARQLGLPTSLLLQMASNLLLNGLLGAVPLFGDLFSFQYKCHAKNAALLLRTVKQGDDGTCELASQRLTAADLALVLGLTVPIVLLVGGISFWFWKQGLHFL